MTPTELAPFNPAADDAVVPMNGETTVSSQQSGVLLIGADFQALGVARALAEVNVPVFLLETERGIAKFSRNVRRRLAKHDLLSDPAGVEFLRQLAERESLQGWAIFCVNDETVEFLAKNHDALADTFRLAVPPWEITRNFYEKDRAGELAVQAGLAIPKSYPSSTLEDLLAAEPDFPVVLKPTFKKNYYDKTNDKAVLVKDRESLIREYQAMNRLIDSSQILAQEFLTGGTRNLYSFAAIFDGEKVVAGLAAHRLRQHPMTFGHATTYAESRHMPELEALATRFLKALNYRGIAEVEFMFDERSGTYKFIEMNGRFWGWHALASNAGMNFPLGLFQMLQEMEVTPQQPQAGVKWVRLLTDAPTVLKETMRGRMSPLPLLRVMFSGTRDAVWSWRDPLPFMAEVAMAPYLWWKKGF